MATMLPLPRLHPSRSRDARRRFLELGIADDQSLDPVVRRSWLRSRDFGLQPVGRIAGAPHASLSQLLQALEQQRELVASAGPVLEFVHEQTRGSGSMVILSDADGMLLHTLGEAEFVDRAERVALRAGATWHERWRGTNAIGTAIAEGASVTVHGAEHFLERNDFLTCTAAPIVDPGGRLLGVLDISGDRRTYHPHTRGLVHSAVRMIEQQLFESRHANDLRLRLHMRPEGVGTITQGSLALSPEGRVLGADTTAARLLGLDRSQLGSATLEQLISMDCAALSAWSSRQGRAPRLVQQLNGSALWVRLDPPARSRTTFVPPAATVAEDALAALDRGDALMHGLVERARRVLDKPIALLMLGESGAGKEVLARAVHASSARHQGPFVAVNCAALPESLIEAELFGYRPGAFTGAHREGAPGRIREAAGGTLFLDEIGDMPLAMQARLLRVLQERMVQPLGGGQPVPVDFRLISATHRDLRQEIAAGRFREDLYYRLNGLALQLPPLRRRSDLPAIVAAMLGELSPERELRVDAALMAQFERFEWPGNLRQLTSALHTAIALIAPDEDVITREHLPEDLAQELASLGEPIQVDESRTDLRNASARMVREAIHASGGNMSLAARRLGISRNTLYRKAKELAISN